MGILTKIINLSGGTLRVIDDKIIFNNLISDNVLSYTGQTISGFTYDGDYLMIIENDGTKYKLDLSSLDILLVH